MPQRQLILGSSSEPRKALLERLMLPFEIHSPDIDESPAPAELPQNLVLRLAKEKALAVAKSHPQALIISADQVGVLDGQIQGKPLNRENAIAQLEQASGKTMRFFIGLGLYDARTHEQQLVLEEFDVIYRHLSREMIENYLKKEQPYQCAGACKAEGLGVALIREFRGRDFSALIGLPLIRLVELLEKAGLDPLS